MLKNMQWGFVMELKDNKKLEILTIFQEECAELIQAASKIIRFGDTPENMERLTKELGDLQAMTSLMHEFDMFSFEDVDKCADEKVAKLKIYSSIYTP